MKKTNKLISILLVLAMLLSMAPISAFAAENIAYVDVDGSIKTATSATSVASSTTSWGSGWYYVGSNVTVSSRISVSGDVKLILGGGYTLTASQGIHVGNRDKLTVYSQETAGTLIAYGTEYDAAIGGNGQHGLTGGAVDSSVGTIIINGGNITAQGGNYGAGIGGGWNSSDGNITVNGGNITAQGGDYAAGIGFSQKSTGTANIDITGGTVNANGGLGASGIGTGYGSENTALSINISGGKITAKGDHVATSDIGNGVWAQTATSVSITGGIIDASRIGNYDGGTTAVIKDLVGAEFVNDPSSFVPEGYIASYNEATGYYAVGPKGAIINGITSVDSISVIINGTEHGITAEDYTISSNNLILFVPSGKLLVTVNGEEYYGDFDGEFVLLKKYYEVINLDVTPVEINVKTTYELSAEITPDNALNQSVSYEITDAGTTGATVSGNKLTALYGGTIKLKAIATDGYRNYSEDFTVEAKQINVTGISNDSVIPASAYPSSVVLPDTVVPSDASYNIIEWSVVSGTATISDNTVYFNESGTVTLRATVKNGLGSAKDFVKDYSVNVLIPEISKVSVADGNITISKIDESKLKVTYANGKEGVFDKTQLITVTGSSTSNSIVVESGSPIIVLDGCEVIRSQYYNPVTIKSGACAEIVLSGTNTLEGKTAICVAEGAELTISGNGVLNANGLYLEAAAIGGESNASSGKITVNSGYLKIKGDGAGIGVGGYSDTVNCGEITINGGDITIESKGTGIGGAPGKITVNDGVINITVKRQNSAIGSGGAENTKGSVTINGGTITAAGSQYSAVIGARRDAGAVDVTITGGEITVTGGEMSSGIGNGYDSDECKVTITGGNITATGGMSECGLNGVVTIDNATVNAIGGRQGSGIKGTVVINSGNTTATGGLYSDGIKGTVTVNGGTVTANGGSYGYGTNGTLTINGGEVTANGSTGGAGIGCKSTDTVTINGGTVYARGSGGGAGIGGGKSTDCGTVIINGGTVTANGGTEYSSNGGGAGIGGGYLGNGGTVVITGGNISATRGYNAQNIGAGAYMSENGTLKDADGNNLNLNTISLDGATADTVVTKVEGISYGLNDVKTINTNKLYFYLPADTAATSITAGGIEYICNDNLTYRTAHNWKDATCSAPTTCEACGATEGSINPSAHSWANNDGICANGCGLECDHAGQASEICGVCGKILHTHSFSYSASGDTITAVCENTDGNCPDSEGTLTILAPADLYVDGTTAKEATIENNLVDTSVAISDITYSAPYGLPPKDAGTYTASVTVGGATATVEFTLLNYAAKVTDKDGNAVGTYKTLADAITAASASEGSTVTLLDDVTLTAEQDIRFGKFTLDLNGNNLVNVTDRVFYTFPKVDLTIKDSGETGTIETKYAHVDCIVNYGKLTVESGIIKGDGGIDNYGVLYFNDGTIETDYYPAITNHSGSTVYIYDGVMKNSNSGAVENAGTFYIYGGEIDGFFNKGTAYISGGKIDRDDYAALNLLGGTLEVTGGSFTGTDYEYGYYSGTPFGEWTIDIDEGASLILKGGDFPNGFVIDEKTANTLLAEDYYYKDADGKLITVSDDAKVINGYVKVSKGADLSDAVITLDETQFTYSGMEYKPTVIVTVGGKTLTEGKDYTLTFANNVNAGTATVTVTGAGDYTGEATKEFTIVKADNTVNAAPTPNTLTYKGEAQNLIAAGEAMYGTIVYSLDGTEYSETIPQGTDAGDYTVFYKVIGDSNHKDTEPATVIATITAKDISDGFIILGDPLTYNGTEQTQTVEKVLATGTAPEVTYTVSGNKATNVGVYLLTVTGTGNFTGEAKIAFEIALDDDCISHLDRVEDNGVMKWNVKSTDRESLEYIVDQLNNAVTNIADADKKSEWADIKEACEDMLRIINSIELFIADVEEDYAEFDIETVKSSDVPALDKLVSKVNEIKDRYGFNLTDEEEKKLEDILDGIEKLKAKIDETADEIARIDEAVNGYDKETVKSSDVPELGKLIEDIKALTDGDNLTEDEKAALEEADKAIDELVEKLTEVAEEIKRVDEAVKSYDEETVKSTDSEDLAQLKEDIQNLIDSDNTTENEKTALEEMIEDIEGLEDKIAETEEKLEEIKDIENNFNPENVSSDDKAAIEDKIAEIEAVNPDNLTDEQKAEYDEIKAGFEALLEEIAAAEKDIADIGVELEKFDEERVTKFWEDDIEALKAKIDELLADENMGETEKAKLNEYKAQAEKLTEIINTPKEYFSLRFFYLIWDCLTWKYNGILWIFSKIFSC